MSEPEAAANDVFDVRRFRTVVVAMVCLLAIEAAFMFPPVKMTVFDLDSATKGAVLEVTRSYDMMAGAPWTPFRESWGEFTIDWPVLMFEVAAILVTRRSRASALETESGPHAGRRNLVWVGQDVIQPLQRLARLGLRIGYALWL